MGVPSCDPLDHQIVLGLCGTETGGVWPLVLGIHTLHVDLDALPYAERLLLAVLRMAVSDDLPYPPLRALLFRQHSQGILPPRGIDFVGLFEAVFQVTFDHVLTACS